MLYQDPFKAKTGPKGPDKKWAEAVLDEVGEMLASNNVDRIDFLGEAAEQYRLARQICGVMKDKP